MISSSRGDARSLDKEVHRIIKRCTLAKFSQFFREIGSFLPFSGNLWGARTPSAPPLTAPLSSSVFDVRVNAFGDFVNEVSSGDDENQKATLRKLLNQFTKISRKRKPDGQINIDQTKKRRVSDVENILPPEMVEKILKLLKLKEICQAQLVCKRWKEIIVEGNLVKKVAGKT